MTTQRKCNEVSTANGSFHDASETTPLKSAPGTIGGVTTAAAVVRIVTCIVSLAEGYDGAIFGAVATRLVQEFHLTPRMLGLLAGMVPLAFFLGAPFAGVLMGYCGRKMLLFWMCLVISSGALVQSFATSVLALGVGRFIIGFGVGAATATVTVYVAEVSPASVRGLLTSLEEIFLNLGMSLAFAVSWMLTTKSGIDWRDAMLVGVVLPLIGASLIPWPFTPESPRYYLLCGKHDEARLTMKKLGISDEEAEQTMQAWIASNHVDATPRSQSWQTLQANWRPLMLVVVFMVMIQATAIIALHNLMPWVLSSRMEEEKALRWAAIISMLKFIILVPVCFYLLDAVGRRPLLCTSAFIFASAALFTAIAFQNGLPGEVIAVGYGITLCSFSAGMGPASWPYMAELLPTSIRAKGTGIALLVSRVMAMTWMFSFPVLFAWKPEAAFGIVFILTSCGFMFFLTQCPETSQKTLENIQETWTKQGSA